MKYDLYIDMDGVVANWNQGVYNFIGKHPDECGRHPFVDIGRRDEGRGFFRNLPMMDDAMELWNHAKKYNPTILTATGNHFATAEQEKRDWIAEYFGDHIEVICVDYGRDKYKAVKDLSRSIIIDDLDKVIEPWRENGGIGILHTSAENTIFQHKRLLNG